MGINEMMKQAEEIQSNLDQCKICGKKLPPGSACNKLYDEKIGSFTVCIDCSIKAIHWYVKKLYSEDKS